jgi:hypothetical protein
MGSIDNKEEKKRKRELLANEPRIDEELVSNSKREMVRASSSEGKMINAKNKDNDRVLREQQRYKYGPSGSENGREGAADAIAYGIHLLTRKKPKPRQGPGF